MSFLQDPCPSPAHKYQENWSLRSTVAIVFPNILRLLFSLELGLGKLYNVIPFHLQKK